MGCCDGRGTQWIDNLAGCKAMEVEGQCGEGGCWPFHVAPAPEGELIYCCTKPHREEQKPAVAEQQVQVQTESKADGICEGADCCDGRGSSWFDNKAGCLASKQKVSAVDVNHFTLTKETQKPSIVATSIGMKRKNKNPLSQNSKLTFKLTPKLTVCASGQIAAIQEHGTITSLNVKQRKLMVSAVAVIHSRRMESSTVAASIGTTVC